MNVTAKQRKMLWICVGVVVGSYVVRSSIDSARQAAYYQQQTIRAAQQRANAKAHPPAPARVPPARSAAAPTPGTGVPAAVILSGNWRGRTAIPGRGLCTLSIELHENEAAHFSGFSSLGCSNYAPLMSPQERNPAAAVLNRMSPATAVLSGLMDSGSIHCHVDKTIGTNSNGCAPTAFTLTPFGTNQLAAQWDEATCSGGHMILWKVRP